MMSALAVQPLPIDPLVPEVTRELSAAGAVVIEAPPGAGKTTRVPAALLDAVDGEVLVAEPRRLAARLAAARVADERGERLGGRVGYSVRFEDVSGPETRLRFVTDGVLLRRLIAEPELPGVGAVVLDEFHERHLATDVALALLRRLRTAGRPDLWVVVMSATLDAEPIAKFLGCRRLRSEGRVHELTIEHQRAPDDRPLELRVLSAVKDLVRQGPTGDVLVFLPGASEIRRARDALSTSADTEACRILPLHGDLPMSEQAQAVAPTDRRKIVLATNVAESSVTIDGVTGVVDSGLARVATHSPWTGVGALEIAPISRASAKQRAGRAGRTAPGRVLRLYTRGDLESRRPHDAPEIERLDLAEILLQLHGAELGDPAELEWLSAPPDAAYGAARGFLRHVGAVDDDGLTSVGRRMLGLPVHPRLGRLVVSGIDRGVGSDACALAGLLGERDLRLETRTNLRAGPAAAPVDARGDSDLADLLERFREAREHRFDARRCRMAQVDVRAARAADRVFRNLLARAPEAQRDDAEDPDAALGLAVLDAFPDRVAKRRGPGEPAVVLCTGEVAELGRTSIVHDRAFLVAVEADRRKSGRRSVTTVRLAQGIEPEWLLDRPMLEEGERLVWADERERVERVSRLAYGSVVLEESAVPAQPSPEAAELLAKAASSRGIDTSDVASVAARIHILREHWPQADWPTADADPVNAALRVACRSATSLAELRTIDWAGQIAGGLGPEERRLLFDATPETIRLPGGRTVKVRYDPGKPPWVETRLQDFFGTSETPRICQGRLPLTLHLLAPNRRAVQVTTDLAGFWQRHYPSLRKQLMRRYPKHSWPEDGASAKPPPPHRLR